MENCLDYVKDHYGDTHAYLLACGIANHQIEVLQTRLVND